MSYLAVGGEEHHASVDTPSLDPGILCRRQRLEGRLWAAFEALKKKLATEGLFEESAKRPLPVFPRAIGLITSSDAAALRELQRAGALAPMLVPNMRLMPAMKAAEQ